MNGTPVDLSHMTAQQRGAVELIVNYMKAGKEYSGCILEGLGVDLPETKHDISAADPEGNVHYISAAMTLERLKSHEPLDAVEARELRAVLDDPKTDPAVLDLLQDRYSETIAQFNILNPPAPAPTAQPAPPAQTVQSAPPPAQISPPAAKF